VSLWDAGEGDATRDIAGVRVEEAEGDISLVYVGLVGRKCVEEGGAVEAVVENVAG
jgi:hypothetical protein